MNTFGTKIVSVLGLALAVNSAALADSLPIAEITSISVFPEKLPQPMSESSSIYTKFDGTMFKTVKVDAWWYSNPVLFRAGAIHAVNIPVNSIEEVDTELLTNWCADSKTIGAPVTIGGRDFVTDSPRKAILAEATYVKANGSTGKVSVTCEDK